MNFGSSSQPGWLPVATGHSQLGWLPVATGHSQLGWLPVATGHSQLGWLPVATGHSQLGWLPVATGHKVLHLCHSHLHNLDRMITRVTYVLTFVELMLLVSANRAVYFHGIHNILLFLLLLTMQQIYTDVQIGGMLENLLQCYKSKVAT